MTREDGIKELHDCRITSLGKLTYGYVLYEETSKIILNKVVDSLEDKIAELEKNNNVTFPFLVMLDNQALKERIAELEYKLEDNHTRAEEIISSRENHIEILHSQIAELENRIAYFEDDGSWNELVFKCKLAENKVAELEAQNKALTDMVEMQSEKISRLEEPKSCDGCKYHGEESEDGWGICSNIGSWLYLEDTPCHATCQYYEPKDN